MKPLELIRSEVVGDKKKDNDNKVEELKITDYNYKLVAVYITIIRNEFLESIQFELCNNASLIFTPVLGIKGNNLTIWNIPQKETISQIILYYENCLNGIQFVLSNGSYSPLFGSITLNKKILTFNKNQEVISYGGTYNENITSIYFISKNIIKNPSPLKENKKVQIKKNLPQEYYSLFSNK